MDKIILNSKLETCHESATLKINTQVQRDRAQGIAVYHFGFGQSPFPVHPKIVASLSQNAHRKEYIQTQGLPALRQAIAQYYKSKFHYGFSPENIIIGPGSKELLFQALYLLEGDVFIPAPSWVSYAPQAHFCQKNVFTIQTQFENRYKLTPRELEEACKNSSTDQKILIINSPSNPTGQIYNDLEIQSLVKICQQNNIIVISDEIYGEINFSASYPKGFFHHYPEKTIVTAGLSKAHSAGGYRLGFLATSQFMQELIEGLCTMASETFSAVSSPIQYAAIEAYQDTNEINSYLKNCQEIHKAIGTYVFHRLEEMDIDVHSPEGGFYLFPSFDKHRNYFFEKYQVHTSNDLTRILYQNCRIALLPGSDFYISPDDLSCRLAYVDYDGEKVYQNYLENQKIGDHFISHFCPNIVKGIKSLVRFLKY
ncbi:MAG: aminotransferase class I/II-fold pyridoxal phosphate-dependent enzyme [Halobacteriovoraceae bacterium]|nr:aminotransferase class I/II-fold pyridoxal phosphate-dependent enzyme [Halobacteriovoraceae bacterium]MCB9095419.1 aminotransferase class I/II-fold pyridoxal phosphate-dependent enzyme [Halobacteriovoraceae bacterium]